MLGSNTGAALSLLLAMANVLLLPMLRTTVHRVQMISYSYKPRTPSQTSCVLQDAAAATIQRATRCWLVQRRAARERATAAADARYAAVMRRHGQRMQQLELEKRRLADTAPEALAEADARRAAAAARIQAAWRGRACRRRAGGGQQVSLPRAGAAGYRVQACADGSALAYFPLLLCDNI
jgi:hypothetical protein